MLYPDVRLLLAVFPNDAPEMVRFFGMLMYLIAPTAVAVLSVLLGQLHRSHHTAVTREAFRSAVAATGVLVAYALRFGVSAYHRDSLYLVNNIAVHGFYLFVLLFLVFFIRLVRRLPRGRVRPARGFRFYFEASQLVGLYVYVIGLASFWVTSVNLYVRLIELGIGVVVLGGFFAIYAAEPRAARELRFDPSILSHTVMITGVFLGLALLMMVASDLHMVPRWIDPVLIFPVFAVVFSTDLAALILRLETQPREAQQADAATLPAASDDEFFGRMVAELGITDREREVLVLVMQGKGNREIAERLGVAEKTVRNHLSSLYGKTDAANRVELVQTFELPPAALKI